MEYYLSVVQGNAAFILSLLLAATSSFIIGLLYDRRSPYVQRELRAGASSVGSFDQYTAGFLHGQQAHIVALDAKAFIRQVISEVEDVLAQLEKWAKENPDQFQEAFKFAIIALLAVLEGVFRWPWLAEARNRVQQTTKTAQLVAAITWLLSRLRQAVA
jgi:hypothetical protein